MAITSLAEHYRSSAYAAFPHEHRAAGSLPISFLRAEQQAHDFVDPALEEISLVLVLRADTAFRWHLGDGWRGGRARSDDLMLSPARTEITYECGDDHELLVLSMPADAIASTLERETGRSLSTLDALSHRCTFRDERVHSTALAMWHESVRHDAAASLMVDGLIHTLLAHLLRLADAPLPDRPVGRLTPPVLARIEAWVDEHLAEPMTVAELASLAALSPVRFSRAFRDTTGTAPWAWVTERRLRRAAERLARPAPPWSDAPEPIASIAAGCGFSSQSHLTRLFRRRFGTTPARYRRDALR